MRKMSIRLDAETYDALKRRAKREQKSIAFEARRMLEDALFKSKDLGVGTYINIKARKLGGVELDTQRDRSPIESVTFD